MKILIPENTNIYVIPDIHGCYNTLKRLIENVIVLSKNDYLFFLGDYIDKGPNSALVLDYIIDLRERNYNIFALMGNHEKFLLDAYNEYDKTSFVGYVERLCKSTALLNEDKEIKPKYLNFFNSLSLYYEINEKFILVHAGLDFNKNDPFSDVNTILAGITVFPVNLNLSRRIIHGHFIKKKEEIINTIENKEKIINLDNGCYLNKPHKFYNYEDHGNLFCLNLKDFSYFYQKNID